MSTAQAPAIDMDKLNAFIGQFVTDLGAAVHTGMVVIGEKLGLYKALADGPMNSAQLAAKTKTDERYLREWLASQAAGGYITYDERAPRGSGLLLLFDAALHPLLTFAGSRTLLRCPGWRDTHSGGCDLGRLQPFPPSYGNTIQHSLRSSTIIARMC